MDQERMKFRMTESLADIVFSTMVPEVVDILNKINYLERIKAIGDGVRAAQQDINNNVQNETTAKLIRDLNELQAAFKDEIFAAMSIQHLANILKAVSENTPEVEIVEITPEDFANGATIH